MRALSVALSEELQDLAEVVAREFVNELGVLHQENGGHVARGELGPREGVKVADGKVGLPLELVVAKGRREFVRVAPASPGAAEGSNGRMRHGTRRRVDAQGLQRSIDPRAHAVR